LLEELARQLLEKENGARGMRVDWTRINAPPVSREIFLGMPSRDPKHLWALLRPKVEGLHLGYGVEAVTLTAFWTQRIVHRQLGAWETGDAEDTHDQQYAAFLDTLLNRWRTPSGAWQGGRVMAAKAMASHTPEVARGFAAVAGEKDEGRMLKDESSVKVGMSKDLKHSSILSLELHSSFNLQPSSLLFVDRPTTLLDHPEPAQALALQPDHPPGLIVWRGREHVVTRGVGPERIATAWWGKNTLSTRDYFKLQTAAGVWLWVFRELESSQWFVHGTWS
jgi:protein ImuB